MNDWAWFLSWQHILKLIGAMTTMAVLSALIGGGMAILMRKR